jgi:hypothetical protein
MGNMRKPWENMGKSWENHRKIQDFMGIDDIDVGKLGIYTTDNSGI